MPVPLPPPRSGRIVILGAGPCGLACADELDRLGHHDWILVEAARTVGGLASSVVDDAGFTWDLGGHVVFSHFGEFDRLLAELFSEDELLHHDRSSFVRYGEGWVPYPFQQHLHHLPRAEAQECLEGLIAACRQRQALSPDSDFDTWLRAQYGSALVERFFTPYNTKVWATPPERMSASWVAERVAPVDLDETLRAFLEAPEPPSRRWGPNSTFAFPAQGGTGEIWRRLSARLSNRVRTGTRAVSVDTDERTVSLEDGSTLPYEALVATLPLDRLTAMTATAPQHVRHASRRLRHNTVAMVGLGYRTPTTDERSWLYFPQPDVPFYRATNFGKYAPANVPHGDTGTFSAWMTETSVSPGARIDLPALADACDTALRRHGLVPERAALASTHVEVIPYAYPVPILDRDEVLNTVVPWLEAQRIHPRGRFGTWRYEIGNMDHAVKMGIDIARRLIRGEAEELVRPDRTPADLGGGRS